MSAFQWKAYVAESLPPGIYWWRLPENYYGGVKCRPEFAMDIALMRDGVRDKQVALPRFAKWTGWKHELPKNLECRLSVDGEVDPNYRGNCYDIYIPEISLLACPFCGLPPRLRCYQSNTSGRLYFYVPQPDCFSVHCHKCAIRTPSLSDLAAVQSRWNTRVEVSCSSLLHALEQAMPYIRSSSADSQILDLCVNAITKAKEELP